MSPSDCQPRTEDHFGFPLIVPLPSCDFEDTTGSQPFPHQPVPACHRLHTGEALAFIVPIAPSRQSSSLRHLNAGSALSAPALPVSTAGFCSRCLIGRSLSLRPAGLPCTPDWVLTIPFRGRAVSVLCQTCSDVAGCPAPPSLRLPDRTGKLSGHAPFIVLG